MMGLRLCVASDDLNTNPIVQGSGTGRCVVPNVEAGPQTFSLTINDPTNGYGIASIDSWLKQISPVDGSSYLYAQHGDITSLSSSSGGSNGGTTLTIYGTGFAANTTANTVLVGGVPCPVLSVSITR